MRTILLFSVVYAQNENYYDEYYTNDYYLNDLEDSFYYAGEDYGEYDPYAEDYNPAYYDIYSETETADYVTPDYTLDDETAPDYTGEPMLDYTIETNTVPTVTENGNDTDDASVSSGLVADYFNDYGNYTDSGNLTYSNTSTANDTFMANDVDRSNDDYYYEVEEGEDFDPDAIEERRRRPFQPQEINSILAQVEKYFVTQAPATTATATTVTTGAATTLAGTMKCWHCDEQSLADCFANGSEKTCHIGDQGTCMLEVTEQNGRFRNICMGCKQAQACEMAKSENFWDFMPANVAAARYARPDPYDKFTKCKPEDAYNSSGSRSYCRQCCYTSDCFGFNGFTDRNGALTAWTDVIAWGRTDWKADL